MEQQKSQPKIPFGLSILRIIIFGIILLIGAVLLFGFVFPDFDPISFIVNTGIILLMLILLVLAIAGVASFFKPKPFSPTEDFRNALIRICRKAKPFNVKKLFLRGEDMRTHAEWGKIVGLGYLPYIAAQPIRDNTGNPIFEKDKNGKIVYKEIWDEIEKKNIQIPKQRFNFLTEKDGDVLFVVEKQKFPFNFFFRGVDIIRANRKYVSDLIGDIFIKDVNLVPFGEFLYPSKQWQEDILHILKQNEIETIITTFKYNLDLVSQVTQMSLGSDPTFQKMMGAQSERLSANPSFAGGSN